MGTVLGGVDSSGGFAYQYNYTPFGQQSLAAGSAPTGYGNVYGMAGMEYDGATGLYHAGARYYDPALQRFISEDPIRGKPNLFTYAGNNPVSASDLTGMQEPLPAWQAGETAGWGSGEMAAAPSNCQMLWIALA